MPYTTNNLDATMHPAVASIALLDPVAAPVLVTPAPTAPPTTTRARTPDGPVTGWLVNRLSLPATGSHPGRVTELARSLGLDPDGFDRLVELAGVLGRVPHDLPEIAAKIGVHPKPLYAVVRDLGLTPSELLPFGADLRAVLRDASDMDPVGDSWATRLRRHLAHAGVRTDRDVVLLAEVADRVGLNTADLAVTGSLTTAGLSWELLRVLPADLVRAALESYRVRPAFDAASSARSLGLLGPAGLRHAAATFGTSPAGLHQVLTAFPDLAVGFTCEPLPDGEDPAVQGYALVSWIRDRWRLEGRSGDLDSWLRWTARLGFDAGRLHVLLPAADRHPGSYVMRLLGTALPGERPSRIPAILRRFAPPAHAMTSDRDDRLRAIAGRIGVPADVMIRMDRPTADAYTLPALSNDLGLTPTQTRTLVDLAVHTGHLPDTREVLRLASRTGRSPGELIELAAELRVDPVLLTPLHDMLIRDSRARPGSTPAVIAETVITHLDLEPREYGVPAELLFWLASRGSCANSPSLGELICLRGDLTRQLAAPRADAERRMAGLHLAVAGVEQALAAAEHDLPSAEGIGVLTLAREVARTAAELPRQTPSQQTLSVLRTVAAALRAAAPAGIAPQDIAAARHRFDRLHASGPDTRHELTAALSATTAGLAARIVLAVAAEVGRSHAVTIAAALDEVAALLPSALHAGRRLGDRPAGEYTRLTEPGEH